MLFLYSVHSWAVLSVLGQNVSAREKPVPQLPTPQACEPIPHKQMKLGQNTGQKLSTRQKGSWCNKKRVKTSEQPQQVPSGKTTQSHGDSSATNPQVDEARIRKASKSFLKSSSTRTRRDRTRTLSTRSAPEMLTARANATRPRFNKHLTTSPNGGETLVTREAKVAVVHAREWMLALDQGPLAIQCAMQVTAESAASLPEPQAAHDEMAPQACTHHQQSQVQHDRLSRSAPNAQLHTEVCALTSRTIKVVAQSAPASTYVQTSRHKSAQAADTATVEDRTRWLTQSSRSCCP